MASTVNISAASVFKPSSPLIKCPGNGTVLYAKARFMSHMWTFGSITCSSTTLKGVKCWSGKTELMNGLRKPIKWLISRASQRSLSSKFWRSIQIKKLLSLPDNLIKLQFLLILMMMSLSKFRQRRLKDRICNYQPRI